ncbi:hypothetical protein [Xanthovirga aplysinae]|uniref:hypothetical protein n=1 Tax=Xanthovirga aplysinae TaxID=2529853 RepID=UPI0012BCDDC7|nr:hypothetical protein [Xanthovirga aplysinae]MTI31458.1 hypothetical protein [Xanthovirga aplysinae]
MKNVFESIKNQLSILENIQQLGLYDGHMKSIIDGLEHETSLPAVALQFRDITYTTENERQQSGKATLRVFLAGKQDTPEALDDLFDLRLQIHQLLQEFYQDALFDPLDRQAEEQKCGPAGQVIFTMDYGFHFIEDHVVDSRQLTSIGDFRVHY